MIVFDL